MHCTGLFAVQQRDSDEIYCRSKTNFGRMVWWKLSTKSGFVPDHQSGEFPVSAKSIGSTRKCWTNQNFDGKIWFSGVCSRCWKVQISLWVDSQMLMTNTLNRQFWWMSSQKMPLCKTKYLDRLYQSWMLIMHLKPSNSSTPGKKEKWSIHSSCAHFGSGRTIIHRSHFFDQIDFWFFVFLFCSFRLFHVDFTSVNSL